MTRNRNDFGCRASPQRRAIEALSLSDTPSFRRVCLGKEHADPSHYGSRWPKVTYRVFDELEAGRECPVMGQIGRQRTAWEVTAGRCRVILRHAAPPARCGSS